VREKHCWTADWFCLISSSEQGEKDTTHLSGF
jgi:hypothetical protein